MPLVERGGFGICGSYGPHFWGPFDLEIPLTYLRTPNTWISQKTSFSLFFWTNGSANPVPSVLQEYVESMIHQVELSTYKFSCFSLLTLCQEVHVKEAFKRSAGEGPGAL